MSLHKEYTWHKIAESKDELIFASNDMLAVKAGNKNICLVKHKDVLFGCAVKCPHAGGIMNEGYVDPLGNIVCPIHRYRFNLVNGRSAEGYYLKTWPVEIREDGVFVGIDKTSLF
ncbi:MAG: Rieske 2Fe-2S domain-containing protein [Ferruginibacter sp.]